MSCPDVSRFDRHTAASLNDAVDELVGKHGAVTNKEFDFLQKALGIVFCKDALVFDHYCRNVACMPETIFWDWMHCLVASGGIGQYHLNQVVLSVTKCGISLADIDEFCTRVSQPKGSGVKLGPKFFQDRIVQGSGSHIKAFASEMLVAIPVFGIYMDIIVKPAGLLRSHERCFDLLREITATISKGDRTVADANQLIELLHWHHVGYQALYPECMKPKLHFLKHAAECIAKFRCNLNCFGPERKHKEAKTIASFSFKKVSNTPLQLHPHCKTTADLLLQASRAALQSCDCKRVLAKGRQQHVATYYLRLPSGCRRRPHSLPAQPHW